MAEVADFHISLDGFEEDEVETLGSISYWPHEFEHEEIYSSESDPDLHHDPFSPSFAEFIPSDHFDEEDQRIDCFGSDTDSVAELNDFIRQDHQVNHPLDVNLDVNDDPFDEDPFFRVVGENNETGSNYLDLGLGLGRIDEEERDDENDVNDVNGENDDENGEFMIDDDIRSGDFFVGRRCESVESSEILGGVDSFDPSFEDGLRDVGIGTGIGSYSDEEVDDEDGIDFRPGVDDEVQDDIGIHLCWDCLRLDDPRESNDFYEWEDVGNRVEDRVLSMMMEFEERSVSPSIETEQAIEGRDETMRNSEWEVLLQVNSLDRNVESEHDLDHDDYIYPTEYETLFAQFAENENAIRGSPPTAKTVIESLPSIVLTQDDIKNKGALCAVCKDEIATEEQAKLLPCSHYYHGDCILPWLNIRNTCPVCRFELPTDDPDYEQRRTLRAGRDSSAGASQVMYDFQMFPED